MRPRAIAWAIGCAAIWGCGPDPCADGYGRDDDGNCVPLATGTGDEAWPDDTGPVGADDTGGSGADDTGQVVLGACDPPEVLAADPMSRIGEVTHTQTTPGSEEWFMEIIEVELDLERQIAWTSGAGGLMPFDISDPTAPVLLSSFSDRYHKLAVDGDQVFATHRDQGLSIFEVSDPSNPQELSYTFGAGLEGIALVGDSLLAVHRTQGAVWVYDVSDPESPQLDAQSSGLGSPWEIVLDGDVAYVADNDLGVVPVDISNPKSPQVGAPVDVGGGVQDVAVGDGALYAAAGGAGVAVLDISDPMAPVHVGSVTYGASVQSVAVDGDVLWAVNQEDVIALDIREPLAPISAAAKETEFFSMHVAAGGGLAWVGDWNRLSSWSVDLDTPAPEADLSTSEVFLREDAETLQLEIANRGAATLEIAGLSVDDDRLTASVDAQSIAPGEVAALTIEWAGAGSGEDVQAELCVATNDADEPLLVSSLHNGFGGNHDAIGQPAPDFTLQGLDGNTYVLSEQLGHPVVLVYFATW